jgi:D-methionine transport system ATP-binding protein
MPCSRWSDEATSALDPETTDAILALLRDINRRFGLTIVLITHEMRVIRDICDNVLVLEAGRVAEQGPVWRVFGDPQHDATRALLQPLRGGLPDDVAARLQPAPPTRGAYEQLIELSYTGTADVPELAQIADALRHPTRLLRADLDRIQGRTQGRLLIAAGNLPHEALRALALSQYTRSLGYVPAHD